jgi:hypothetical protein
MLIGDHSKRNKPHKFDYALALAYETLEAEKCPKCGVPIWWAYTENNTIEFEHQHIDCEACAWDENQKPEKKKGRTRFVVAVPVEGFELPTREDYQNEVLARAMKEAERKNGKNQS